MSGAGSDDRKISVVSYDGHRGAERPRAVVRDGERLTVQEVEDAWIEAGPDDSSEVIRRFVVRCVGQKRFELAYSEERGWKGRSLAGGEKTR